LSRTLITRRAAAALLSALPLPRSLRAQSHPMSPRRRQIFSGTSHVMLLEPDGTLKVWLSLPGAPNPNLNGLIGLGHADKVANHELITVPSLKGVLTAAAGTDYSVVVLDNGQVLAWGRNFSGTLGITRPQDLGADLMARPDAYAPTPIVESFKAESVSAGEQHVLAVTRDGTVFAWGDGGSGRLGIGALPTLRIAGADRTLREAPYPIAVPALTDVAAAAAGGQHSVFLMKDGAVRACGSNRRGQLGDGTQIDRSTPVRVLGIEKAVAVVAGRRHSAALLADGRVTTWGESPAIGRKAANGEFDAVPAPVGGVQGIRSIISGLGHILALTETGTVISWGDDNYGTLGHGVFGGDRTPGVPKGVSGLSNVVSVAAGPAARRSFAILADGTVMTWGLVPTWERPRGDPTVSPSPMRLALRGFSNP